MISKKLVIGVVGLGYVGLPLSIEFAKKYKVYGYDINKKRVNQLKRNIDDSNEVTKSELSKVNVCEFKKSNKGLVLTDTISILKKCNFFIVTVPTPVDQNNEPDLKHLINVSIKLGQLIKKNDVVVYESTVFPGASEEVCLPLLEKESKMKLNKDFFLGYSPERINIGDKTNTITNIKKIVSGSNIKTAKFIQKVYETIISAGTYLAPSIKVAEAAKVIENTQRFINISYMNELAKIFSLLNIDTHSVLEAASTKWNFHSYIPGLIGGHCIGIDHFYLTKKAREAGYESKIINSCWEVNKSMGSFIADEVIKELTNNNVKIKNSKILILGFTFKENSSDVRNSNVISIVDRFNHFQINTSIFDPLADKSDVKAKYGITLLESLKSKKFDAVVLAVAHRQFKNIIIENLTSPRGVIYDVKGYLNKYTKRL